MPQFNFHKKQFALLLNSSAGTVNKETIFRYQQQDDLVTADYQGGGIRYGKIIARLKDDQLHMYYQCLTDDNEFKAGRAIAQVSLNEQGKIKLALDWEWLGGHQGSGTSAYLEL